MNKSKSCCFPLAVAGNDFDGAMNDGFKKIAEAANHRLDCRNEPEPLDAALLADLAAGQTEAFWCLWKRHEKGLRQLCLRKMDGQVAEAEDALSQVMLKALDRLPACAEKILHPEAWLHRLALNLCVDLRRGNRRRT